ncbi:hypothetical protein D3C86_903860 [compost metagenome]
MLNLKHGQRRIGAENLVQMFAHTAAARKLNDGVAGNVPKPHLGLLRQGMIRAAHQKIAIGMQEFAVQVRHVSPTRGHGEIDLPALHHVQAGVQQGVAQVHHDARMRLSEAGQQARQPARRQRRQRGQRHAATAAGGVVAHVFHDQVHIRQQAAGGRIQHPALGGQLHMPGVAVKQP